MKWSFGQTNTSSRIVKAALFIICLFLFALLLHLYDVRELFFENAKDTLVRHLDTGESVINRRVFRLREMSEECAQKIQNRTQKSSINMILAEEQKDNPGYRFAFLDQNGILYTPTITNQSAGMVAVAKDAFSYSYHSEFLCVLNDIDTVTQEDEKRLLGIQRIATQDGAYEYLMIDFSVQEMFQDEIFEELTDLATCCMIDNSGHIVVADEGFKQHIGEYPTFFEAIEVHAGNTAEVERKTKEMRRMLVSSEDHSFTLKLGKDADCFVVYQKIHSTKDLFLVACFHDDVLDSMVQTVLTRTFLVGVLVFALILLVLLITWKRDSDVGALVEKLAYEDSVTGGKNLNYFKTSAWDIISQNKEHRFCIYRFDIVRFRYINEAYGHMKADRVLMACIEEFKKIYGNKEVCVRINSDQFLALVSNDETIELRYQEYLKAVGERARDAGVKYPIRFRLGIYRMHKEDSDLDIMIDHANVARKSLTGEEKVLEATYSERILAGMKKINEIESVMQQALSQGEFKIYLQPKWNITKDCLIGAEALVRWQRKDGTMVYPSDFIPIFENNGFIEKLDFYMLEKLCMQMREYRLENAYRDICISVNQSRILILNPDYAKNVEKLLQRYEIPVDKLEIEITETVFLDEKEKMIEIVNQLKKVGVMLAMDDFGSGYSSLNILKDIPFDVLKIDREFFSETNTSLTSILILEKIVEMAKGLGISVICEGVETQEQIKVLRDIGCEWVQGYYYGKPIPLEEFYEKYCRIEE